jgi:hypothetical protein
VRCSVSGVLWILAALMLGACANTLEPDAENDVSAASSSSVGVSSSSVIVSGELSSSSGDMLRSSSSSYVADGEFSSSSGGVPASSSSVAVDLLGLSVTSEATLGAYFAQNVSNEQVLVRAVVSRILADDTVGDQHQRFIFKLTSGQTLLVAHNIDLGARVPLSVGETVYVYGEYEWNAEGGVVHWTHVDPDGSHVAGWILYNGTRYQ